MCAPAPTLIAGGQVTSRGLPSWRTTPETLTSGDRAPVSSTLCNTFRGGLRMALGSQDKLYDGVTTNECGEDFADNLQDGDSIKWAWLTAMETGTRIRM